MGQIAPSFSTRAGPHTRRERPLKKLPQIFCGFLLLVYTLFFVYRAGAALFYGYPLGYGEGAVFYEASQLFRGNFQPDRLYVPNEAAPYQAAIYNPLFYYLQALTMWLSGPTALWGGRLISVLSSCYIGFSLYRIARQQELVSGRRAGMGVGLAAALTPFATAAVYTWGVFAKADMLMVALSLAAVERVWRVEIERRQKVSLRPYVLAGLLCALALLTKQSALAAPLAIVIWLGLGRRWRDLAVFVGVLVGVGGSVALIFQLATGGAFFRHIVTYNAQPYDFNFLGAALNYLVSTHLVLLVLAAFWVARPLVGRYERTDLWRIYLLTALGVSLSAGKVGSDFNYYLESLCLLSLLGWWQAGRLLASRPFFRFGPFRISWAFLALVALVIQLFQLHHIPVIADSVETPGPASWSRAEQVTAQVRELAARGPLLAEDSGWQTVLGLPVELDDPFVFGQLARDKSWDSRAFLEKLNSGYYRGAFYEISPPALEEELDLAIQQGRAEPFTGRFDPAVLAVLQDRTKFVPVKRIGRWLFLEWKG